MTSVQAAENKVSVSYTLINCDMKSHQALSDNKDSVVS